jgi:hypothetical protein
MEGALVLRNSKEKLVEVAEAFNFNESWDTS